MTGRKGVLDKRKPHEKTKINYYLCHLKQKLSWDVFEDEVNEVLNIQHHKYEHTYIQTGMQIPIKSRHMCMWEPELNKRE